MKLLAIVLITTMLMGANASIAAETNKANTMNDETVATPKNDINTIVNGLCAACHNADGNSVISINPRLAGQHAAYMTKQLNEFKSGKRNNAVMAGMVATLSADDMARLSEYFSAQKPFYGAAKENGPGSQGEKIYKGGIAEKNVAACSACHGPTGSGIPLQFPRIGGQHADYLIAQLKAFRSGKRANDQAAMMRTIASRMSDQEIAAVADYLQGLH